MRRAPGSLPTYRYVGAEARTLGDWQSLGDMGWMDAEGYLYLTDRQTDMIVVAARTSTRPRSRRRSMRTRTLGRAR